MQGPVLIIDSEWLTRSWLLHVLKDEGFQVNAAGSIQPEHLNHSHPPKAVVIAVGGTNPSIESRLREIRNGRSDVIIVVTGRVAEDETIPQGVINCTGRGTTELIRELRSLL